MARNKISDLRNHLFETIELLMDKDKPLDVDRAKAIAQVAGKIIESAKVEVKYAEVTGQAYASDFFPDLEKPKPELPEKIRQRTLAIGNGNSIRPTTQ